MSAFNRIEFKKIMMLDKIADKKFIKFCQKKYLDIYLNNDDLNYICEFLPIIATRLSLKMGIKQSQLRNPINKIRLELLWESIEELKEDRLSYYGYKYE